MVFCCCRFSLSAAQREQIKEKLEVLDEILFLSKQELAQGGIENDKDKGNFLEFWISLIQERFQMSKNCMNLTHTMLPIPNMKLLLYYLF